MKEEQHRASGAPMEDANLNSNSNEFFANLLKQVSDQLGTDPAALLVHLESLTSASQSAKHFEELSAGVREKIDSVCEKCHPYVKVEHFDTGVRHWLVQLQVLFGEEHAIAALSALQQSANLESIRKMKAFITTRLIDHYENLVWAQDPETYAQGKLTAEMYSMLSKMISSGRGLKWSHFDPKVLDSMREMRNVEIVRARLQKLCCKDLQGVNNVPAYLYTLLNRKVANQQLAAVNINPLNYVSSARAYIQPLNQMYQSYNPTGNGSMANINGDPSMYLNQAQWFLPAVQPTANAAQNVYQAQLATYGYQPSNSLVGNNVGWSTPHVGQFARFPASTLSVPGMQVLPGYQEMNSVARPLFTQIGYQPNIPPVVGDHYFSY